MKWRSATAIVLGRTMLVSASLLLCTCATAIGIDTAGNGDWHAGGTWVGGIPPGASDDAVILNGHTVTVNEVLTTYNVGGLTIQAGGMLTHTANAAAEDYKVMLGIGTNLTVEAGGAIDVSFQGYAAQQGPGAPTPTGSRGAAGHGGQGGFGFQATARGPTYGSITNPVTIGSGTRSQRGGGAIVLTVGGAFTNNGTIAANGEGLVSEGLTGGGSGGSVNIAAATIAGTGVISADGGVGEFGNAGGGGGGGRVAIRLTQPAATFESYTVANITALAGDGGGAQTAEDGAAGTVFLKTADQASGDLIIRSIGASTTAITPLEDGTYQFDNITTTNYGVLVPETNSTLNLTGCQLHSDSEVSNITSRIILGRSNSSVTWPSAFTNHGTLSWEGTNVFAMTTDLTVASGGILTHELSNNEADRVNLSITGRLTIDAGGTIDTWARGYPTVLGPGAADSGGDKRGGAGHGGEGGLGWQATFRGTTYGSVTNPVNHGSGAKSYTGGGAVILAVTGALTNNGLITANGDGRPPALISGGGAGGSINLTAATLAGNGMILADGGEGESNNAGGGGGGGRIAIRLTQPGALFDSFPVTNITARGTPGGPNGADHSAAGTVFLKAADESYGRLIIDNELATDARTLMGTNVTSGLFMDDVVLLDQAAANLPTGLSITVYGSWSNAAPTDVLVGGGTVRMAGAETGTVYGSTVFESFICTNGGKTLIFEAGQTNTFTTAFTLEGDAVSNLVLRSSQPGTQWIVDVRPSVANDRKSFRYLDAKDSDARPGVAIAPLDSTDSLNNSNWVFTVTGLTNTWTGLAGALWTDEGNWDQGYPPTLADARVVIPTGSPTDPVLTGPVVINELEIQAGPTVWLTNHLLTVRGTASIAGAVVASGIEPLTFNSNLVFSGAGAFTPAQSTVTLGGAAPVTFTPLGNTFYALDVANTNTVSVTDSFTVDVLTFTSNSAAASFGAGFTARDVSMVATSGATLTFTAGQTYTVNNHLFLRGAAGKPVTLAGGASWNLDVNGNASVRYASVTNSDASGGRTIYAIDSTDGGGNPNWVFDAGRLWIGATDEWTTSGNWAPTSVPGQTNHVLVDGSAAASPRLTNATSIAGLVVVGHTGPAVLTVDMPFTETNRLVVAGDVEVRTNGTLTHTANGATETQRLFLQVGSNLVIRAGGAIDVSERGFADGKGDGAAVPVGGRGGASHAGEGGWGFQATGRGDTYGSATNPVRCGSGARFRRGGGVALLTVAGALTNNGAISATGEGQVNVGLTGGGSGGAVNITAATIAGSGTIDADGGKGEFLNAGGGGGGGRVAVRLTGGAFGLFPVANITADGGASGAAQGAEPGAAGTVYLETASQAGGEGTLTINNTRVTAARTHVPPLTDGVLQELMRADVIVTNKASVLSTTNAEIGDILVHTNSFWTLTNWTLTVHSQEHSLEDLDLRGPGATNRVDHYDQIIWVGLPAGTVIIFR